MSISTNRLYFKPSDLAQASGDCRWTLSLADFPRLLPRLIDTVGDLSIAMAAHRDEQHLYIDVTVDTVLPMLCQRCLAPGTLPMHCESRLLVAYSDEQAAQWIDDHEPVVCDEDGTLSVIDVVSEELLLTLPAFFTHPEGDCAVNLVDMHADNDVLDEKINPFAGLRAALDAQ